MADAVPLIDLDAAPRAAPGAAAGRARLGAPRPVLVLAVLVAVLVTLTAAGPPARTMRPVLAAGGTAAAAFTLGTDALYTAGFGANPDSESGIRRYALPGGEQLWATSLPQNVQNLTLDSGVLLARSGSAPRMTFLDAADGKVLWHLEESGATVITLSRGRALLRTDAEDGSTELRLVSARTGATIWRRVVDGVGEILNDDLFTADPDRIVALGVDGHVTTVRFADGSVLGEGELGVHLPDQLDGSFQAGFVGVTVSGDQLYMSRRDAGVASLTAYGLPELTRRWRTEGGPTGFVHDCGPVLCISDTRWVSGLDPSDGSVRWSDPAWSNAFARGNGLLLAYDQQEVPESAILDARTGAVRRKLGRTLTIGRLELREDSDAPGRTWVAVANEGDGTARTVGSMQTGAPYGCTASGQYLACPTTAGPTTVWQIP
ncbi:PQQ-binding-like beta-propeller repeat protein [Actinoplanes sp. NPDC049599]|uniref:outer membrane protein assembly factor BamB family protein n=1 Tax=Actinoplanes sp. NPDC049599 TaxID=3363903 RepID=UPI0037B46D19